MTTLTAPLTKRKVRLSPHARRVVRDYLVQRKTGTQYRYEYMINPDDDHTIMVMTMRPLAPRGHHQWRRYGVFDSWLSAAIALESLRMAQARGG